MRVNSVLIDVYAAAVSVGTAHDQLYSARVSVHRAARRVSAVELYVFSARQSLYAAATIHNCSLLHVR